MAYRYILEAVRVRVPAKHYEIEHLVQGDIPAWLSAKLPLFGSEDGELYLSSGGRSLIVEGPEGAGVYRIKGADPKGVITRMVAQSEKNVIADIRNSVSACPNPDNIERILASRKNQALPAYKEDRPFNFLTKEAVARSQATFEALRKGYETRGFSHPCVFAGGIAYKNLRWDGMPTRSIVFKLADAESDLREDELDIILRRHLQHATPEQLETAGQKVVNFYLSLLRWSAFDSKILAENGFLPTKDSMIGQNYVIGHVSREGIGLCRVDHTSTRKVNLEKEKILEELRKFPEILSTSASHIILALEMARRGVNYDKDRFSGYYDAALKFHNIDYRHWPETLDFLVGASNEFEIASKSEPKPIPEQDLIDVFESVTSIKIDKEFERKRREKYEQLKAELARQGLTPQMLIEGIVEQQSR